MVTKSVSPESAIQPLAAPSALRALQHIRRHQFHTDMCEFAVSGIVFGCDHFVVMQLMEHLSSCHNPYCRTSDDHLIDDHDCLRTCQLSYVVEHCEPMSRGNGACPTCQYPWVHTT